MIDELRPQRLRRQGREQALLCLAGGRRSDLQTALRADALGEMLTRSGSAAQLWQVCQDDQPVAAAMIIPSAGRVGIVFHSPVEAPGVAPAALSAVLRAAADAALAGGLAFVQSLISPSQSRDADALVAADFTRLAELVYMHRDLGVAIGPPGAADVQWQSCRGMAPGELGQVIFATYEHSLDCPALAGLRSPEDVVASHKASGIWRPDCWWIARIDGKPAGCVLVNDSTAVAGDMDIVYMGVLPAFRGRGLGRAMVRHACRRAAGEHKEFMHVVADTANPFATRIYQSEGFTRNRSRIAYIRAVAARCGQGSQRSC